MNRLRRGIILGALQCAVVLSVTGKLLIDRETCPRVWVKVVRRDPEMPIRGRYLALKLRPEPGAPYFDRLNNQAVLFFVPEHLTAIEHEPEIQAEVTIPRAGAPRPIRLSTEPDLRQLRSRPLRAR